TVAINSIRNARDKPSISIASDGAPERVNKSCGQFRELGVSEFRHRIALMYAGIYRSGELVFGGTDGIERPSLRQTFGCWRQNPYAWRTYIRGCTGPWCRRRSATSERRGSAQSAWRRQSRAADPRSDGELGFGLA